jgi:3-phosphoshikimate 1-carboxyvinyltransferase
VFVATGGLVIVRVPGDKSISHRAVLLAGLASGTSRIRGFLDSADTRATVAMMRALGVGIAVDPSGEIRVEGRGLGGLGRPPGPIDAANSGTTMRLGAGLLATRPFESVLDGDASLRSRPMDRIVEPLRRMGARIEGEAGGTRAPLRIRGGILDGIRHEPAMASAQVKSALLLAGLGARAPVTVVERARTRDHTERMLSAMGAGIALDGLEVTIRPSARLDPIDIDVPGDFSSSAFFLVLGAMVPGAWVEIPCVGANPTRTGLVAVLRRMGADVREELRGESSGEPVADFAVSGTALRATDVLPDEIPGLIDEIPALCVAATRAAGRTRIRGAGELRVKESDRIATLTEALAGLGIPCGQEPDGMWIEGPAWLRPGRTCDTRGDHRIAMALGVLGAATGVEIRLTDRDCVDVSFPGFWDVLTART